MEAEFNKKLDAIEAKIDAIYVSTEKTRKYFFWTMVITVAVFVIPLIGLVLVVPSFVDSYSSALSGL